MLLELKKKTILLYNVDGQHDQRIPPIFVLLKITAELGIVITCCCPYISP